MYKINSSLPTLEKEIGFERYSVPSDPFHRSKHKEIDAKCYFDVFSSASSTAMNLIVTIYALVFILHGGAQEVDGNDWLTLVSEPFF